MQGPSTPEEDRPFQNDAEEDLELDAFEHAGEDDDEPEEYDED